MTLRSAVRYRSFTSCWSDVIAC